MKNYLKINSISLLFFLCLFSIILLGLFTSPILDDLSYHNMFIKNDGLPNSLVIMYKGWSGRIFSMTLWYAALINVEMIPLVSIFLSLIFSITCCLVAKFLPLNGLSKKEPYLIWLILIITFWISMWPFLSHCVYWVTGGIVYIVPLFLGLLWSKFLLDLKIKNVPLNPLLLFLFSIIVGMGQEQISFSLGFIALFILLKDWKHLSRDKRKVFFILVFGVFLGSLFTLAAPGNFNRGAKGLSFNPEAVVNNSFFVILRVIESFWKKASICLISGIFQVLIFRRLYKNSPKNLENKLSLSNWIFFWVGASISSMIPFFFVPSLMATRNFFFPVFFLSVMSLGIPYYFVEKLNELPNQFFKKALPILIGISFFGIFTFLISKEYLLSSSLKVALNKRDLILRNPKNRGNKIILDKINQKLPKTIFYSEISDDPSHWHNKSIATFYGLKSIRISN